MSSSSIQAQELALQFRISLLSNYIGLSSAVFWIYDFILCIPQEYLAVWRRPASLSSVIYVVNKYAMLIYAIGEVYLAYGFAVHSDRFCHSFTSFYESFGVLSGLANASLFTLRVYAIYENNLRVLVVLGLLVLARFSLGVIVIVIITAAYTDDVIVTGMLNHGSCISSVDNFELFTRIEATLAICDLTFNTLAFSLTLVRTYRQATEMRKEGEISITQLLLRDGMIAFFVSFVVGAANAGVEIFTIAAPNESLGPEVIDFFSIVSGLTNFMPNILINHLYLNLKSFESPTSTVTTEAISQPMFPSRVLGNIGAPLHTILDDLDMEDDLDREGEIEEVVRNIRDRDDEWRGTAGRSDNRTLIPVIYEDEGADHTRVDTVSNGR